jgi:hypothetical protein
VPAARAVPGLDPFEDRRRRSCCWLDRRWVSSSSRCIVDQNDSIMVLSTDEATRPIEPSIPASRSRCPNTYEVQRLAWALCTTALVSGRRRQVAICRASTTSSARTWSAIDQTHDDAAEHVQHRAAVDVAGRGRMLRDVSAPEPIQASATKRPAPGSPGRSGMASVYRLELPLPQRAVEHWNARRVGMVQMFLSRPAGSQMVHPVDAR